MGISQEEHILDLIIRYLECRAAREEISELSEWIKYSEANKAYYEQVINIWDASSKNIDVKKINPSRAWKEVNKKTGTRTLRSKVWLYWQRAAAIIIIPFALGVLFFSYQKEELEVNLIQEPVYNEVYAAFGTRSALKLADGSLVWLNSGSSLRYPDRFINKERVVFLSGEAYFEVESDEEKPFIVETPTISVVATGTKFNVLDYSDEQYAEVTLIEGEVDVNKPGSIKNPEVLSNLDVNQHMWYDKGTGLTEVQIDETYKYISWKDGKLIFRNEPMGEVVRKIGQVFNVDIEIHDPKLKEYRYWATFQDESLEEILKLLSQSSPIDYKELKREPLADGYFPKKKVILFYRK
jgi:ferric-dicitrate binding protein FerR (iron transport regulator)